MKRFFTLGRLIAGTGLAALLVAGFASGQSQPALMAFVGAKLIDGTGGDPIDNAILLVSEGRVVGVGSMAAMTIPADTPTIDVSGKVIMPGLINGHGHVGDTDGMRGGQYSRENVIRDLRLYAHYGITTVVSLGGDGQASFELRDAQNTPDLNRSRLFVAGEVVTGRTPAEAVAVVERNHRAGVDFIKIKVDGNLGSAQRMAPEVYTAVIERAHELGLPVASHLYYLDDARALVAAGTDFIAHSIRDQPVDDAFIAQVKRAGVYYSPTLMRDVSTFAYESEPEFFRDPFFLEAADMAVVAALRDSARQARIRNSPAAQANKAALGVALRNLNQLAAAGVPIVMGTDSGPPGRFQGYFEHAEMDMMANDAGLTPRQVIASATGGAAAALKLKGVGTLEPGNWADFLVLAADPLVDIANTRSLESVWIAGNRMPD